MRTTLTNLGHDVQSAAESAPDASDAELLALALAEQRILITEDKDFGEVAFVRRLPHPCIIRFTDMPVAKQAAAMRRLLDDYAGEMHEGQMIVVTRRRVRVRHGVTEQA